jgi:uncharacterized protein (DUF427 family)
MNRSAPYRHPEGMAKATWNSATIAESTNVETLEGNLYFPAESLKREFLEPSEHTTVCSWKGVAHYYHVVVNGEKLQNAAWYYPQPNPEASNIKDCVAFWKGVKVDG